MSQNAVFLDRNYKISQTSSRGIRCATPVFRNHPDIISGALLCPTFMRPFGGRALIGLLVVSGTLIVHFYLHRSPRRAPYG